MHRFDRTDCTSCNKICTSKQMITEMKGCNNTQNDICINAISLSHLILFCFPCLSQKRFVLQYMSLVFSWVLSSLSNNAGPP